jgi:hypothetical protein
VADIASAVDRNLAFGPHPEEPAQPASRRMDARHLLAAILGDARKSVLLRPAHGVGILSLRPQLVRDEV